MKLFYMILFLGIVGSVPKILSLNFDTNNIMIFGIISIALLFIYAYWDDKKNKFKNISEQLNNSLLDVLSNNPDLVNKLRQHYLLTIVEKQSIYMVFTGCFAMLYYQSSKFEDMSNFEKSQKVGEELTELFLTNNYFWSWSEIVGINSFIKEFKKQDPLSYQKNMNLGVNIVANFYSNESINQLLGYKDISKENGIKLLEDFNLHLLSLKKDFEKFVY